MVFQVSRIDSVGSGIQRTITEDMDGPYHHLHHKRATPCNMRNALFTHLIPFSLASSGVFIVRSLLSAAICKLMPRALASHSWALAKDQ